MKKFAKICLFAVCLTLAAALCLPAFSGVYADAAYNVATTINAFKVTGFPETYEIGGVESDVTIPAISNEVVNGDSIKYIIYAPNGRAVNATATSSETVFTPNLVGEYKVVYYLINGETKVVLTEKILTVSKLGYYFEFPENTSSIIPSEMNLNVSEKIIEQGFNKTITLPMPKVFKSVNDEEVENPVLTITVSASDATSEATIQTVGSLKTFTPDKACEYIFTYTYGNGLVKKQFAMNVNNTFDNEYELGYSFNDTKPTTATTGVELELPTVTGKNKTTGNTVDVITTIKYKKVGATEYTTLNGNKVTFTEDGDYIVTYSVKNVFGTTAEDYSFTISGVKDKQDPVAYFGEIKEGEVVSANSELATVWTLQNILLPKICATDNSNGTLTYTRKVRNNTYSINRIVDEGSPNKYVVLNYNSATFATDHPGISIDNCVVYNNYNDSNAFTADTYTLVYTAKDAANNSNSTTLNIKLVESISPVPTNPTASIDTVLPLEVMLNDTIEFAVPTATDDYDTRMDIITEYSYDDATWTKLTETNANGKYEIKATQAGTLYIRATATNDFGLSNNYVINESKKTVSVVDVSDTVAPTFDSVSNYGDIEAENDQGTSISLPTILFADDKLAYLDIVVIVRDGNGKIIPTSGKSFNTSDPAKLSLSGGEFVASKSGVYTITFVATDIGNNFYVYSLASNNVNMTVAPTIIEDIFDSEITELELGETITLPIPKVKNGDGESVSNPTYEVVVLSAENEYKRIVGNKFTPLGTGKYVLQYKVADGALSVDSPKYTINVKNTLAPTITTEFDELTTIAKGSSLTIPELSVKTNEVNDFDAENSKVEIKKDGNTMRELKKDSEASLYTYTFTSDGTYTIVYTAVDTVGNRNTSTFTIKVGDTEKPKLTLDAALTFSDKIVGDKLVIDPALIKVTDDKDTEINKFDDLKIVVKNSDTGEAVENNFENATTIEGYEYNLDVVGAYTVTFTLTDNAGNTTSIEKTVNVTAEAADSEFPTQTLGIILIVVAVVILAGVVLYFVLTRKKVVNIEKRK